MRIIHSKPPKTRFKPSDHFEYDGSVWKIIYMYRLQNEPGVWYHCLEEQEELSESLKRLGFLCTMLSPASPDRVKYEAFRDHYDAQLFFSTLFAYGDRTTKTTQQLLRMKKL